ncbi:MAG: hypothetical protein FWF82_07640, partial [Oscillospiraceae bacterium]|nr:hypothetical protein [Oscillospiraceae bacterium]
IIVTCAGFDGAMWDTTATVGRYSTTSDNENGIWQTSLPNNTLPYAVCIAGDSVFVLTDNAFYVLDYSDGKIVGEYAYSGELSDFAFSDNSKNACAILTDGHTTGGSSLISLNRTGGLNFVAEVSEEATQAEIRGEEVAVIQPNSIRLYKAESSGVTAKVTETTDIDEEYAQFVYSGGEVYLLGYNSVWKVGYEPSDDENQENQEQDSQESQ